MMGYMPKSADEWLELIHDIAYDYDGYRTVEGLKSLIDEMSDYAHKARVCLHEDKVFDDRKLTQFKRIKNMNIEQMALFLMKVNNSYVHDCMYIDGECKHPGIDNNCAICFKEWLESEVSTE